MPNRMLRDWTNSEKINAISVNAERFFIRLIMKADDYGCFYADVRLLKPNLFPLLLDEVREADISRWMAECQKAGLIVLYEFANKKYLQIMDFGQRLRQKTVKFPLPNDTSPPKMPATRRHDDSSLRHEEKRREENRKEGNRARAQDLNNSNLFKKPVIPTKKEVFECFIQNGGTREMAKRFYDDYETTGWFHKGSPLENFRARVYSFIENWNKNESKNNNEKSSAPLKRADHV